MRAAGLVVGTSGNISVRAGDLVAVSPSALDYDDLTPEMVGVHRLDGTPVDSTVVDAASVNRIVQQAAAIGQRLWIRPADVTAS